MRSAGKDCPTAGVVPSATKPVSPQAIEAALPKARPGVCRGRCAPLWPRDDGGGPFALRTRAAAVATSCPEFIELDEVRRFCDAFELLPGVADLKSASRVAVPINAGTRYGGSKDPAAPFAVHDPAAPFAVIRPRSAGLPKLPRKECSW